MNRLNSMQWYRDLFDATMEFAKVEYENIHYYCEVFDKVYDMVEDACIANSSFDLFGRHYEGL